MTEKEPLVIERLLNAPVERVWQALTDIKYLKQWVPFFPDFKAEVGFETRFLLGKDKDHQYLHICEVTEVEVNKKLNYSWRYGGHAGDSYVTFELFAENDKTKLILTHRITQDFPADNEDFALKNFEQGWNYTADGLKKFVENN